MNTSAIPTVSAVFFALLLGVIAPGVIAQPASDIRLIVRGDDMGVCHTGNEACLAAYRDGIVRSAEVIVPGQWFLEAVKMVNENPGLDVGVHLTLTSEWELCKWRPITAGKSLVDADGYFYPTTAQRGDFPPNTGFLNANVKLEEVEAELRGQIELARKHIKNVTHLSVHMGTATATPALRQLTQRLADEYKLPVDIIAARYVGFAGATAAEKETSLLATLEKLQPGTYIMVEHPGFDTPEMRGLGHKGYWNVASDRDAVTRTFTSEKAKQVIKRRNIRVVSYGDVIRQGK
jgi:predicted glycoside hydrolase/deacetylase ChbG (UPF0249 family)